MHVSVVMVELLAGLIERSGGSRERFLREARIEPGWLEDSSMRLPIDDYFHAVDAAISVSGDPAFGLHLGEQVRGPMFGEVGALTEHAQTLRQCVEAMQRYSRLISDSGFEPTLHEHGTTAAIRFEALTGERGATRMTAEFVMTALTLTLPLFVGGPARPSRVRFAHAEPSHGAEYTRIFGDAVRFKQRFTELVLPRAWLDGARRPRSQELYAVLTEQAERSIVRLDRDGSLRARIERIAAMHGPRGPTMEEVAAEFAISARSLRRRLSAEGLDFNQLVLGHRIQAAKRLLERPNATLQATAHQLGFNSVTAFHRAFKRWTGKTPKEYQSSF